MPETPLPHILAVAASLAVLPAQVASQVEILGLDPAARKAFIDVVKQKCAGKY